MKTDTVEKLIWMLIYAGLLIVGLGLAVKYADESMAWVLMVVGGVAVVVGVVLIYVRSKMTPQPQSNKDQT